MIYMVEDNMPHAVIFFKSGRPIMKRIDKDNVRYAYEDLMTAYQGISSFIGILDGVCEGLYSTEEIIVAGIIITDALDGYLMRDGYLERAKYIRINGLDMVILTYGNMILSGKKLAGCRFDGDNGKLYRLKTRRGKKKPDVLRELTAPTANPQKMNKLIQKPKESLSSSGTNFKIQI